MTPYNFKPITNGGSDRAPKVIDKKQNILCIITIV